jgi:hypothetical protein
MLGTQNVCSIKLYAMTMARTTKRPNVALSLQRLMIATSIAMSVTLSAAQEPVQTPPLDPQNEHPVAGEPLFLSQCDLLLQKTTSLFDLEKPVVTLSTTWGLVLRRDFKFKNSDEEHGINRVICWKNLEGKIAMLIAIGQVVTPLQ